MKRNVVNVKCWGVVRLIKVVGGGYRLWMKRKIGS